MIELDWDKIWEEFDEWEDKLEERRCPTCSRNPYYPDWEEEMEQIERIVNKHIKKAQVKCNEA